MSIGLDVRPENGEQIDEVNVDVNIVTHGEMEVEDQDQFQAVERLKLFEAKYSSLNEERDKVGKAKEALEPQETGSISTSEERMQVNNNKILVEFFYVCVILFFFVFFITGYLQRASFQE